MANETGNKATIDWRDLPDANGFTHWQHEEAKAKGIELKPPDRTEQMMTVAAIPANKELVEAYDKDNKRHTVVVGNNSKFAIGDPIKVGPHENGFPDVWKLLSGTPQDLRRPVESTE